MRVIDLLETAMKTGDMIVSKDSDFNNQAIVYCEELYTFFWCDRHTGKYKKHDSNQFGFDKVIVCSTLLSDGWYLEPIKKIEPISINGTTFTDYDKAIQYLNMLKKRNNTLETYKTIYNSTGIKPIIVADNETLDYINNMIK